MLNTTAMSTTEVIEDISGRRCPDGCTCNHFGKRGKDVEVKCYGEDIKSVEQLDLPEGTMAL